MASDRAKRPRPLDVLDVLTVLFEGESLDHLDTSKPGPRSASDPDGRLLHIDWNAQPAAPSVRSLQHASRLSHTC
jgi:hypothetical protein